MSQDDDSRSSGESQPPRAGALLGEIRAEAILFAKTAKDEIDLWFAAADDVDRRLVSRLLKLCDAFFEEDGMRTVKTEHGQWLELEDFLDTLRPAGGGGRPEGASTGFGDYALKNLGEEIGAIERATLGWAPSPEIVASLTRWLDGLLSQERLGGTTPYVNRMLEVWRTNLRQPNADLPALIQAVSLGYGAVYGDDWDAWRMDVVMGLHAHLEDPTRIGRTLAERENWWSDAASRSEAGKRRGGFRGQSFFSRWSGRSRQGRTPQPVLPELPFKPLATAFDGVMSAHYQQSRADAALLDGNGKSGDEAVAAFDATAHQFALRCAEVCALDISCLENIERVNEYDAGKVQELQAAVEQALLASKEEGGDHRP